LFTIKIVKIVEQKKQSNERKKIPRKGKVKKGTTELFILRSEL